MFLNNLFKLIYICNLVTLQQNIRTVVHFITARRLVVPSSNLLSFIYCPAPSTFSRLALIFSDNSPDTSSKSLMSLLLLINWYLKENLLTFIDWIGKPLLDGKTPRMLSKFPSQMSDHGTKWVMYTLGCPFSSKENKIQKQQEWGSLLLLLLFSVKQSFAVLRTLLRQYFKKKTGC